MMSVQPRNHSNVIVALSEIISYHHGQFIPSSR